MEDVALSIRAERLISRMFSRITMNRIGTSDKSDRAAGWSQPKRIFESKPQRALLDGSSCFAGGCHSTKVRTSSQFFGKSISNNMKVHGMHLDDF